LSAVDSLSRFSLIVGVFRANTFAVRSATMRWKFSAISRLPARPTSYRSFRTALAGMRYVADQALHDLWLDSVNPSPTRDTRHPVPQIGTPPIPLPAGRKTQ
jgi:hypothetical protein